MEIVGEHVEKAEELIESAKTMDQLNVINDSAYNAILERAEMQLKMADLYIEQNF